MTKKSLPTPEELRQLLRYEPDTGKLYWKERPASMFNGDRELSAKKWNSRFAGKEAFNTVNDRGYLTGLIFCRAHKSHRIAWAVFYGRWPSDQIDHINGNKQDNRILNLREATQSENKRNTATYKSNTSGYKGVSWSRSEGKWVSRIGFQGKQINLGYFDDPAEAHAAYCEAAKKYHGEFARTA